MRCVVYFTGRVSLPGLLEMTKACSLGAVAKILRESGCEDEISSAERPMAWSVVDTHRYISASLSLDFNVHEQHLCFHNEIPPNFEAPCCSGRFLLFSPCRHTITQR